MVRESKKAANWRGKYHLRLVPYSDPVCACPTSAASSEGHGRTDATGSETARRNASPGRHLRQSRTSLQKQGRPVTRDRGGAQLFHSGRCGCTPESSGGKRTDPQGARRTLEAAARRRRME